MHEAHSVVEPERLVREALRLALFQLGEYRLDQFHVLVHSLRLYLVTHDNRHRLPQFIASDGPLGETAAAVGNHPWVVESAVRRRGLGRRACASDGDGTNTGDASSRGR